MENSTTDIVKGNPIQNPNFETYHSQLQLLQSTNLRNNQVAYDIYETFHISLHIKK